MDLKEQIIKFLNEETSQVRTLDGEGFAITLDNYKEDTEYLADELIKLFSLHSVSCCSKEQLEKEYGRGFSDGCEHARPAY